MGDLWPAALTVGVLVVAVLVLARATTLLGRATTRLEAPAVRPGPATADLEVAVDELARSVEERDPR